MLYSCTHMAIVCVRGYNSVNIVQLNQTNY